MNKVELELIHRELDGETSSAESGRLHALLAENSEVRRVYDELASVDHGLRHANMIEPPAWLKRKIMASLPAERRSRSFSLATFFRELAASMQARPALAYAYMFVIGAVFGLGFFAVALQESPPSNEIDLYGALANDDASGTDVLPIQIPGFRGRADVSTSGQYIIVDLTAEAEERTDVRLVSESSLALRGFTRKAYNADTSIAIDDEAIEFGILGSEKFAVIFHPKKSLDPSVRLEVRRNGRLIYEEQLRAAEP